MEPFPAKNASTIDLNRRAMGLIFIILLMDVIGFTILVPIAPYIVRRFSNDALMVTLLSAVYAAAQFIAAPLLGSLSDRYGRRVILITSLLGSAAGYFIFGVGGALWVLILSRIIDGLTAGNRTTAVSYLIDLSSPQERAKNLATVGISSGLGFILGPAMGGALGQINLNLPLFFAGGIALLSAVLVTLMLPESLPASARRKTAINLADVNPFMAIRSALMRPGVGRILGVGFLFNLAFEGIQAVGGVFIIQKFSAQPWQLGGFIAAAGVATALMQLLLTGRLVAHYGEKRMALVSLSAYLMGGILMFFAPRLEWLYPIIFVQTAIGGFIFSTLGALLVRGVGEDERGKVIGVDGSLSGLAAMLGPVWTGIAYDHILPGSPFLISAIFYFVAMMILI